MAMTFPAGKTAFLVIHGIGEQKPYETLDAYARGLIDALRAGGAEFSVEHHIVAIPAGEAHSLIRLQKNDSADRIDIHECYWAHLTEGKASWSDVGNWLLLTAEATFRYYRENEALQEKYEGRAARRRNFPIYRLLAATLFAYPLLQLVDAFIPRALRVLFKNTLTRGAAQLLVGYVGDVTIYTTTDEKSQFFQTRRQIVDLAGNRLAALLAAPDYERVVLAGHSLGSVIAYDTLNQLNLKANLQPEIAPLLGKLHGLVTFGSPLDKIAFFFREHAKADEFVRRRIVDALHSFRARPLDLAALPYPISSSIEKRLEKLPWINFFAPEDPISGALDFYDGVHNSPLQTGQPWGIAHVAYWANRDFYQRSFDFLFAAPTQAQTAPRQNPLAPPPTNP